MRRFIKLIIGLAILINLNACMTAEEALTKYNNMPEKDLCVDYFKFPDYNYWQGDRRAAIIRRGIDCTPYMAEGLRKAKALNALEGTLETLSKQQSTTSTGTSLSTGFTKVCYYDDVGGRSAITVSATAMCPQSHSHNITGQTKVCLYDGDSGQKALTVSSGSMCPARYN